MMLSIFNNPLLKDIKHTQKNNKITTTVNIFRDTHFRVELLNAPNYLTYLVGLAYLVVIYIL